MGKRLVVAEKPSVARDIARVLGASQRGEGYLYSDSDVITWAIGHLVTLKEPEELDERFKRWNANDLPILPEQMELKILPKTRSQYNVIKKLMNSKEIDSIVCATDSGREGELIFRYIYQMAGCKKPFERLWISSMTDEAIRGGFAALRPGNDYDALYESARCRSEADWLVGMNASRAFTLRYDVLLSVGRVQTPTLQMLVKRRKEIDAFIAEPFYTVQADFGDYQGTWFDPEHDNDKRIRTEEQAQAIIQKVKGQKAAVQSVKTEEKRELAPQLYDLTTLQREASSMLGFTADKTLKTAQSLYEKHKLITYPRTDSRYLSHDMGASVKKALYSLPEPYAQLAQPVLAKPISQPKRIFDDAKLTDHHAIIPTGRKFNPASVTEDEKKLFDLIARRLIAAFYPPYVYNATRVITGCLGEVFQSNGTVVVDEGFKAVYRDLQPRKKAKEDSDAVPLPPLQEDDERVVKRALMKKDQTKPPKEHTDASLLSEMEHAGRRIEDEELREQMKGCSLGTPATRAAIIERLISVGYARRKGRQIMATEKGVRLIDAVPPEIASPETTGRWEQALERIARGEGGGERFLEGIRRLAAFLTKYAGESAPEVAFEREERRAKGRKASGTKSIGLVCPICGKGQITENTKAFGCSRWQEGCKFTIWKDGVSKVGGPVMDAKLVKALLSAENGDLRGSTGVLHFHDGYVSFTPKKTE
ncbi:MAG: DNA topoisomerase III [Clostridia bacterium]|nr:DNA topoisomerase III [Clostridia bacterium]